MSDRRRNRRRPPLAVAVPAAIGIVFMTLPLVGLLTRTPWGDLGELFSDPFVLEALRLSVVTSLAATVLSLAVGVPMAWLLARTTFPGRSLVRGIVLLPMMLAPVVGGAALCSPWVAGDWSGSGSMGSSGSCCPSRHRE